MSHPRRLVAALFFVPLAALFAEESAPDGFIVTEFMPKVSWSKKHKTINCSVGHQLDEGFRSNRFEMAQ